MEGDRLLQKLKDLVDNYVENPEIRNNLKSNVTPDKVKYILGELELHKNKKLKSRDKEIIKDLFFHFC